MDKKKLIKAAKLAVQALRDKQRVYSFDAYLVEKFGVNDPTAVHAKERKDELESASENLLALVDALEKGLEFDAVLLERSKK